ncbi:MAG: alkaline phosphatase D family protein [Planctomycetes bacterium]|nr:alkaline phosphatase D family protein [Planctomycetota bacterium]MCB9870530.1 alkaline phosphatase D family protein [Planctomycetota bacterium]
MKTLASMASGLCLVLCSLGSAQSHSHGTMIGALRPTSMVVWTRASGPADVTALYNRQPTIDGARETAPIAADPARDFTAHIELKELEPDTTYYIATKIIDPLRPSSYTVGPFCTARTPPVPSQPAAVEFLVSADVLYQAEFDMFDLMRADKNSAFYVSLGDMPYADGSMSQAEYWERHKQVRSHAAWLAFTQRFPVLAVWDDHEVVNDWDKSTNPQLVGWGTKAFRDYMPLPIGAKEIYRTVRWGAAVELFLLDTRSHRDVSRSPSVPGKTMLGATQLEWLKKALLASDATFKILCTSVPLRYGNTGMDDWRGFVHERRELLQFILQHDIRNVLAITGDNHIVSVHHHIEGVREFMIGPLAQDLRPEQPGGAQVRFRAGEKNYARVRVDTTQTPATLTFEYRGRMGPIYSETIRAETPARARVSTDEPAGDVFLSGPMFLTDRNSSANLLRVEPGHYRVSFAPRSEFAARPAALELDVLPGTSLAVAAAWRETPAPRVLLAKTFDEPLSGHLVVDDTNAVNQPSSWVTDGGILHQASPIGDTSRTTASLRNGTSILFDGSNTWDDYSVSVRMKSHDRGRLGVLFRVQDARHHYRFFVDTENNLWRLDRRDGDSYVTLAERPEAFLSHNFYDVRCVARGSDLTVYVDGFRALSATDSSFATGTVGLQTANVDLAAFDDLVVTTDTEPLTAANLVFRDDFTDGRVKPWQPEDHTNTNGPSRWVEAGGALLQLTDIGGVNTNDPLPAPGSVCLLTQPVPDDVQLSAMMLSLSDGAFGVVFRYKDAGNHYRFTWHRRERYRALQKVVANAWTDLWRQPAEFNRLERYEIRIEAVADRLRLWVSGELLADVVDGSHTSGSLGIYTWKGRGTYVDSFTVQKPARELPTLAALTDASSSVLHGAAPGSADLPYVIALSLGDTPGVPLSLFTPSDPRTLSLVPDDLFIASLAPNPLWTDLQGIVAASGRIEAKINWPKTNVMRGTRIFASGWTGYFPKRPVQDLLPKLVLIAP